MRYIKEGHNTHKLYFSGVYKIIVISETQLYNLQLFFKYGIHHISFPIKKINNYQYELNFKKILGIFDNNNCLYIDFDSNDAGLVSVFGQTTNIATMRDGVIGTQINQ